jgi:hypothetical protein
MEVFIRFSPKAWRADTANLSWETRAFWFELVILMHESPRRGFLLKPNGRPWRSEDLMERYKLTQDQLTKMRDEIEASQLWSRDGNSKIPYCRRMIREEGRKTKAREHMVEERLEKVFDSFDLYLKGNPSDQTRLNALLNEHHARGINVRDQLAKMKAWLTTRPERRMTLRFIQNWLMKCEGNIKITTAQPDKASEPGWMVQGYSSEDEWRQAKRRLVEAGL